MQKDVLKEHPKIPAGFLGIFLCYSLFTCFMQQMWLDLYINTNFQLIYKIVQLLLGLIILCLVKVRPFESQACYRITQLLNWLKHRSEEKRNTFIRWLSRGPFKSLNNATENEPQGIPCLQEQLTTKLRAQLNFGV